MNDDTISALAEHYRELATARGDEEHAHIGDLAAACDRATWHRRRGDTPLPWDARTASKLQKGREFEANAIAALRRNHGTRILENYTVVWDPTDDTWDVQPEGSSTVGATELVGHIDAVRIDATTHPEKVYEAKSTSFLKGAVPTEPAGWYLEQAIGYAAAVQVDEAQIIVECRESGKAVMFDIKVTPEMRQWARERALEILHTTNPAADAPAPEPRYGWACKSCRWAKCPRNAEYRAELTVVK